MFLPKNYVHVLCETSTLQGSFPLVIIEAPKATAPGSVLITAGRAPAAAANTAAVATANRTAVMAVMGQSKASKLQFAQAFRGCKKKMNPETSMASISKLGWSWNMCCQHSFHIQTYVLVDQVSVYTNTCCWQCNWTLLSIRVLTRTGTNAVSVRLFRANRSEHRTQ